MVGRIRYGLEKFGLKRSLGSLIVAVLTFLEKRKVSTKIVHPVASRMGSL